MSGTMEISQETLETIGSYVKGNLAGWIKEVVPQTVAQLSPDTEARLIRSASGSRNCGQTLMHAVPK